MDPIGVLLSQHDARVPELLGLREARMAVTPFTFLRGTAAVMAADLARTPTTTLETQLGGDTHLRNIETFATREPRLVFDVTDVDETIRGPFDWDLKRLATSFVLAAGDRGAHDPLVLQLKEAAPSALEPFVATSARGPHGRRVVEGQRTMQSASDIFLGWLTALGPDGVERDFYVRQFRDMKGRIHLERLDAAGLVTYARLCGHLLADAHARGCQRRLLASYLGRSDGFVEAIIRCYHDDVDVTGRDHQALLDVIADGRLPCEPEG